jgi:hypothetical protein
MYRDLTNEGIEVVNKLNIYTPIAQINCEDIVPLITSTILGKAKALGDDLIQHKYQRCFID